MTSRLDRLVLLLDAGSTSSVRGAAARQLGDLAATRVAHPSVHAHGHAAAADSADSLWRGIEGEWREVITLVARVLPLLESRSSDTRQAAAAALAYISRAVGIWDPTESSLPDDSTTFASISTSSSSLPSTAPSQLKLASFDVMEVIKRGPTLLGSSGTEYAKVMNLSADDMRRAQKDALGKLGLGMESVQGDLGVDMEVEFSEGTRSSDQGQRPSVSTATASTSKDADTKKALSPSVVSATSTTKVEETDADPYAGLSARERNKLKRQRKAEGKTGGVSSIGQPPPSKVRVVERSNGSATVQPVHSIKKEESEDGTSSKDDDRVVVDPGAKARERAREGGEVDVDKEPRGLELEVTEGEWPWKAVVDRLQACLLSPNWQTRHGAALGLRELLRLQGESGGKTAGLPIGVNEGYHQAWCEHLADKLLRVFALDRFGDYVSDQVVAPVRETAAQTLAIVVSVMPTLSVLGVQKILIEMVEQDGAPPSRGLDAKREVGLDADKSKRYVWQVRHSGLLGLKYLAAVKKDMLEDLSKAEESNGSPGTEVNGGSSNVPLVHGKAPLKAVVDATILGLQDRDDDVRSAAAATLVPITHALVRLLPEDLKVVVSLLWECLADLGDDLSSSVGAVMDLLTTLLKHPQVLDLLQSPSSSMFVKFHVYDDSSLSTPHIGGRFDLANLIPRLFPFFRHTISSVRLAVVNTVLAFLTQASTNCNWIDHRLLCLLFQNLVVEERVDIRDASTTAWKTSLELLRVNCQGIGVEVSTTWFSILTSPIGVPINADLFWSPSKRSSGQTYNVDKAILAQDLSLVSLETIMQGRVSACSAFGQMMAVLSLEDFDSKFGGLLIKALRSDSALNRFIAATIGEEWATAIVSSQSNSTLASQLSTALSSMILIEPPLSYIELSSTLQRISADCQALYTLLEKHGKVPSNKIPSIPSSFSIIHARQVIANFNNLSGLISKGVRKDVLPASQEQCQKISNAISYFEATKLKYDRQVYAAIAGALVALKTIPSKITPLIRSITSSIKTEEDVTLQSRSARSIASFIKYCSSPESTVKSNPSDKLVKNLCTFLCQDVTRTPVFASAKSSFDASAGSESTQGTLQRGAMGSLADTEAQASAAKLVFRGARLAISELAQSFGVQVLERVPKLWSCMSTALVTTYGTGNVESGDDLLSHNDEAGQELLDCLTILATTMPLLGSSVHGQLATLFHALSTACKSRFAVVRHLVAQAFASLCDAATVEGMRKVIELVLPSLADPLNVDHRRGAIAIISNIVESLEIKILPYVIFLIVPVLGRMSDADNEVRLQATSTFATLIKLVPLEAGLPDPPGFPQELLDKRNFERDFLSQLLDGSKVHPYELPVTIPVELRKYQRDGISWLAFLARYQLHGLLCDDMGLGKTLQSIAILASKHHERSEAHAKTHSPDTVHLSSLVVCPSTLTGHWKHEIQTYVPALQTVIYTGSRADRDRIVASLSSFDVVIVSYDVLRNDIGMFSSYDWHYCILDEGHIIKNSKTKLSQAVKRIRAIHRLILSGTPIQNNVLELWSLFDFLMPGFLGSEKTFNERFGKPIASSRDAKSSSKEQEAGALALEALHKQVLPFILRRMKEDVLDDLPPKIIQDYYCELSPLQKQLYDDFSSSQAKETVEGEVKASSGKSQHVFQALQYLRKLVNHPALVLNSSVPRHQAILEKMERSGGKLRDVRNAPKLEALRQLLLDCGIGAPSDALASTSDDGAVDVAAQHRVLIFCQLKQMLDIIEHDLFRALMPTVTFMRMDGSTEASKRHAIVQTFNADPSIDCLLLTTHVGGLGLNLTSADTVIFVEHDWNPMKDLQAMDRAHRLGQKKVVNVYRLITRGTLEEKIMGLQRFKVNIASSVVTQQNSDLSTLGTDGILDLFSVSNSDTASAPKSTASTGPVSQNALLEGLEDLPPEDEYQDLDLSAFTSSL